MAFSLFGNSIIAQPDAVKDFLKGTDSLSWDSTAIPSSLIVLFSHLTTLAQGQITYYYNQRKSHLNGSQWLRIFAWLSGSAGLLMPLLSNVWPKNAFLSQSGYAFLGLSASLIAANSLFGTSSGHARSVIAQIELEKLVALATINWHQALAEIEKNSSTEAVKAAFTVMISFAQNIYKVMGDETIQWSQDVATALLNYEKQAKSGR